MFEIKEIAFQSITKLKTFILGVTTLRIRLEHGPFSIPITFGESKILSKTNSL